MSLAQANQSISAFCSHLVIFLSILKFAAYSGNNLRKHLTTHLSFSAWLIFFTTVTIITFLMLQGCDVLLQIRNRHLWTEQASNLHMLANMQFQSCQKIRFSSLMEKKILKTKFRNKSVVLCCLFYFFSTAMWKAGDCFFLLLFYLLWINSAKHSLKTKWMGGGRWTSVNFTELSYTNYDMEHSTNSWTK